MSKHSTLVRVAVVGLAVASLAACARRPVAETPGGGTVPPPVQQPYTPPPSTGPVTGGPVGAAVPGSVQDFVVNIGDRIYFDLDSYQVRPEAYARLDAQAAWLQRYPQVTVRIEGNADERGTREYNLALGARRAEAVRTYLSQRGVNPARIDTISFGKERPIAAGSGEESWARNRNAGTTIVSGAPR